MNGELTVLKGPRQGETLHFHLMGPTLEYRARPEDTEVRGITISSPYVRLDA
jgi:hypothetical protein